VWGRSFTDGGTVYGHVLDPRTGWPVQGAVLAAVVSPSATETDALSTALLTLGTEEHPVVTAARPELPVLVLGRAGDGGIVPVLSRAFEVME
jgi:FAD:protein FMN transferase